MNLKHLISGILAFFASVFGASESFAAMYLPGQVIEKFNYTKDVTFTAQYTANGGVLAAGYYWNGREVLLCEAGNYCPGGEKYVGAEAAGMYACANGEVCVSGVSAPAICPKGSYCIAGIAYSCAIGYTSNKGATAENQCYLVTTPGNYVALEKAKQVTCSTGYYCPGGVTVYYGSTGGAKTCAQLEYAGLEWKDNGHGKTGLSTPSNCITTIQAGHYFDFDAAEVKVCPENTALSEHPVLYGDKDSCATCMDGYSTNGQTGAETCTVVKYSISMNANGGTIVGGSSVTPSACTVETADITLPKPTKTGYTFGGWYQNSDFTGSPITVIAKGACLSDYKLYAKWTANTYTVTFDKNGGVGGTASVIATFGEVLPDAVMPTKTDFIFKGYYSAQTGGVQYYNMNGVPAKWDIDSDITLFAQWMDGVCAPGMYYNGTSFVTCPKGYYCPGEGKVTMGVAGCRTVCPSGYDDGGTGYSDESQCQISVPQGSYLATAKGTNTTVCPAGKYTSGAVLVSYGDTSSCATCPAGYTSEAGASECYLTTTPGKYVAVAGQGEVACKVGDYCLGGAKVMHTATGGNSACSAFGAGYSSDVGASVETQCYQRCALAVNATQMSGRDYYGTDATDTCEITLCRPGYNLNAGVCAVCPANNICTPDVERGKPRLCSELTKGTHKFAPAGSGKISDCYLKCEAYDITYGTAIPVSGTENYPLQCRFDGLSVDKNPCDIVNGTCVERSCNYNYEMIGGKCQACARENALSYKKDGGNCVVESCVSGFHPNGQACEVDTVECSVPNAVAATRVWDASKQAFGECVITECEEGYHLGANTCQADEQVCELEHGIGIREWNHKKNTWGDCIATKCDPGYTNDRSQTNELWKQCGRCNNMYSAGGELAASSYVDGCEIATCMYEGELYTLENNECVLICDTYSDETGSRRWNASRKKCERTCEPGYMSW